MGRYWIGDCRCKSLQLVYEDNQSEEFAHYYVVEDFATYSWFMEEAFSWLQKFSPSNSSIIIMLGLADCIQSCTWKSYKIEAIAQQYVSAINTLITNYPSSKIYFCSVNPVNGDYTTSNVSGGVITSSTLNRKIKQFNNIMQTSCEAAYVDCTQYLAGTHYTTYDGIRYDYNTSLGLQAYIINSLQENNGSFFIPRFTAPLIEGANEEDDSETSEDYWINTSYGGENPFSVQGNYGSTLPNCTAYAWGRFYEITGTRPTIFTADAECWFAASRTLDSDWETMAKSGTAYDGYERGITPRPGAILCWRKGIIGNDPTILEEDAGHVAIVEQVNKDGSIITSESGYKSSLFWLRKRTNSRSVPVKFENGEIVEIGSWSNTGENSWGTEAPYYFQGFIYCPNVIGNGNIACTVSKNLVTSNNTYLGVGLLNKELSNVSGITDAQRTNALYIWQYFRKRGWSMNAVAALLGNIQRESTLNPGLWQNRREWGTAKSHGFGLTQWTPYTKFTDWCAVNGYKIDDIDVQLLRIEKEVEASEVSGWQELDQWITTDTYNISFKEFTQSTKDAAWLAGAFLLNYERAADQSIEKQQARGRNATYWFDFLSTNTEGYTQKFSVSGFKVDKITPTEINVSFVIAKGVSGKYTLLKNGKNTCNEGTFSTQADGLATIKITKNIEPNSKYSLILEVNGVGEDEKYSKTLDILTPQSYPASVTDLVFTCQDEFVSAESKFSFSAKKPNNFGYWDKNKRTGYEVSLLINGKIVSYYDTTSINLGTFSIKEKFNYICKTGDTVQIGVRTWAKDDSGTKVYDQQTAKTSKPICLLNKIVNAYIDLD